MANGDRAALDAAQARFRAAQKAFSKRASEIMDLMVKGMSREDGHLLLEAEVEVIKAESALMVSALRAYSGA